MNRMADQFQQLQYNAWESQHLAKHAALIEKYNTIKQKESLTKEQKGGKTNKRDLLLTQKKNMTISKLGDAELSMIEKEEVIEKNYNRNVDVIETRKNSALHEAEQQYNAARLKIQQMFDNSLRYYDNEKEASVSKCKREFESKKRILESRGDNYEAEKSIISKTGGEITLEVQKYKLLKEIQQSIGVINMSRSSVIGGVFATPLPVLPEPLGEPPIALALQQPVQPVTTETVEDILARLGEDPNTAIMRAESQANERRLRREADEDEMRREEQKLAYRRQLEREADARKKQNEEHRKQVITPLTQSPVEEENESEEEMTQEEMDAYIAEAKSRRR